MNSKNVLRLVTNFGGAVAEELRGGWRTVGAPGGPGAFNSGDYGTDSLYPFVGVRSSLALSGVYACTSLRAETLATMPLHIRDKKKNIAVNHDLYYLLHDSPNYDQTNVEYTSADILKTDMLGNAYSLIERGRDRRVKALIPIPIDTGVAIKISKKGRVSYEINGEDYASEQVLHQKGFSLDGYTGLSRLDIGRRVLGAQVTADDTAMRTFKNQLKIGGFFKVPTDKQPLDDTAFNQFQNRMRAYNEPSNQSKWMPLPPGWEPMNGSSFRISMADAEVLQSRYFGIEEICRLFNVPPPLIGHTDKASSWASSVEALNMHFLMYSLAPTMIRREKRYWMQLLTPEDRAKYFPRYSAEGLLRVDTKSRYMFYASALQNGWLSRNEVRDMEDRISIGPVGDEFLVQLNMAQATLAEEADKKPADK